MVANIHPHPLLVHHAAPIVTFLLLYRGICMVKVSDTLLIVAHEVLSMRTHD